ncbi:hypothetical protein [Mesorhizobium sp. 2RAF21]|uniref:hypothetical protein n=1 Tax=Mesorhizobium sp. 2RAF21 TaxID=3232995 RepID=UPI003F9A7FCA
MLQVKIMKWTIEFEGRQMPLAEAWDGHIARIIAPYKDRIERAFATARDQEILSDIEIVFFVDDERTWGVRFCGEPLAVQYATDLVRPFIDARPKPD